MTYTVSRTMRTIYIILFSTFFSVHVYATTIIKHEKSPENATLDFPVRAHALNTNGTFLMVGGTPMAETDTSLLGVGLMDNACFPGVLAEKVKVNGAETANPLIGQSIRHLALLPTPDMFSRNSENPVVIIDKYPNTLFLINSGAQAGSLLHPGLVRDATGLVPTTEITNLAVAGTKNYAYMFAAVKPGASATSPTPNFGQPGSGIALIKLIKATVKVPKTDKEKEEEKAKKTDDSPIDNEKTIETYLLANMNAQPDSNVKITAPQQGNMDAQKETTEITLPCAAALDKHSPFIQSGHGLEHLTVNDMYWDPSLGQLFIALQATTGNAADARASGIVVGHVNEDNKLVLRPFAALASLQSELSVAGACGAHQTVAFHKIRTMFASTWLNYVIAVGGSDLPEETKRSVHALPIVQLTEEHGTLAARQDEAEDLYGKRGSKTVFMQRRFKTAATKTADAFTRTKSTENMPAVVGCDDAPADITDLIVVGDTVIITCAGPTPEKAGAFYSHALFDSSGKIKGWTMWQRMGPSTEKMFGGAFYAPNNTLTFITGPDAAHATTIKRTTWTGAPIKETPEEAQATDAIQTQTTNTDAAQQKKSVIPEQSHLATVINSHFTNERGGVCGITDVPFNYQTDSTDSLLVVTGINQVGLMHTRTAAQDKQEITAHTCTHGSIEHSLLRQLFADTTHACFISDGALAHLGAITQTDVIFDAHNFYLFVAGAGGVAMLAQDAQNFVFKKVGTYTNVRKLMHDGPYLYVLTDKKLDRLELSALIKTKAETIQPVTCAQVPTQEYRTLSFNDVIVSEKCALLGTSRGLYRVGNGCDISHPHITCPQDLAWQEVAIPQGLPSIACLCPVSVSGHARDIARGVGGMVYVVNGSIGKNQSRLHRIAIKGTENADIDDTTVQPIHDYYQAQSTTQGIGTYFINLSEYKHACSLEGATLLFARNQQGRQMAAVHALPYDNYPPVGVRSSMIKYHAANVAGLALDIESAASITAIKRLWASGRTMVGGNFGVRIHQ